MTKELKALCDAVGVEPTKLFRIKKFDDKNLTWYEDGHWHTQETLDLIKYNLIYQISEIRKEGRTITAEQRERLEELVFKAVEREKWELLIYSDNCYHIREDVGYQCHEYEDKYCDESHCTRPQALYALLLQLFQDGIIDGDEIKRVIKNDKKT